MESNVADAMSEFILRCRAALPEEAVSIACPTRRLGRSAELCERLLGYIIAGEKTGVFSQPEDFPDGFLPRPGDHAVLTDFSDQPRCLIRYDECCLMPFSMVGPSHVAIETPALRDVDKWRQFHRNYWTPVFEARGQKFTDDLPLVFQRFTRLYPLP